MSTAIRVMEMPRTCYVCGHVRSSCRAGGGLSILYPVEVLRSVAKRLFTLSSLLTAFTDVPGAVTDGPGVEAAMNTRQLFP